MTLFNDLLRASAVDPAAVTLLYHRFSKRPALGRAAVALALARDPAWRRFESIAFAPTASALRNRPLMASFVGRGDGMLVFAGLHHVGAETALTAATLAADPDAQALRASYDVDLAAEAGAGALACFAFTPAEALDNRRGALLAGRPNGRAAARVAATTAVPVTEAA